MNNSKKSYAEQLHEWNQRNLQIFDLWKSGKNFTAISKIYGLTSGRISQICHKQTRRLKRLAK